MDSWNIFCVANFSTFARFEFLTMVLMRIQNFWDLMPCCWKDEWFPAFQRTILSLSSGIMHKEEIFLDGLILEDDGAMTHRSVKNHSSSDTLPLSFLTVTTAVLLNSQLALLTHIFCPCPPKN